MLVTDYLYAQTATMKQLLQSHRLNYFLTSLKVTSARLPPAFSCVVDYCLY